MNIGAVHDNLMESELFGHEKGAFTGADSRKIGLFELAGAGTLFLDEIGEMPLPLQVKLLRVLQERKIRRLGGVRDIPVGARILSATNKDIEALVREGRFREDLYYRLNVVRVAVPPLRERREDIPLLAGFLLEKLRVAHEQGRDEARERRPSRRSWPTLSPAMSASSRTSSSAPSSTARARRYSPPTSSFAAGRSGRPGRRADERGAPIRPRAARRRRPTVPATSLDSMERDAIERALAKWGGQQEQGRRGARHQPQDDPEQDQEVRPRMNRRRVASFRAS